MDLALYILDTTNEIQENPPESGIYQNIGKTRRKGLEATLELYPFDSLEIYGNLSLIDTEILDNPDPNLEGKKVPRVPSPIFTLGMKYNLSRGLSSEIKWRHVGKYYMDNYNLYTYDGYDVVDFYTSYNWRYDKNKSTEIFFSIKNLFDEHYAQSASYFRDSKNYAVAWPRTFWVGFLINY